MAQHVQLAAEQHGHPAPPLPWYRIVPVFVSLGCLIYLPALLSWFSSDDFLHLAQVMAGHLPFTPDERIGGFLRPLIGLSFWIEYRLWGQHAFGYHLLNVLLHIANSLMVVALSAQLTRSVQHKTFVPVVSGMLFLLLPCHAEPVAWISGRTDVLATFFMLISANLFGAGLLTPSDPRMIASLIALTAALFSKESSLALPFVLALMAVRFANDPAPAASPGRRAAFWVLAHFILLFIYIICRRFWIGEFVGGYGAHGHLRFSWDLVAQASARYAWRSLFPPLPPDSANWFAAHAGILSTLWIGLLALLLLGLTASARRNRTFPMPLFLFCAFWFALLPVFNIRIQWTNAEGERFLYLASIFAAMAAANMVARVTYAPVRRVLVVLLLSVQAVQLVGANLRWQQASAMTCKIVEGIQSQHESGRIVLLNKPDSFNGALAFRTGLPEALRLFGPEPLRETPATAVYAVTVFQSHPAFDFARSNADASFYLRTVPGTVDFAEEDRDDIVTTVSTDDRGIRFTFTQALSDSELFLYDSGEVRKLPTHPASPLSSPDDLQ